MDETHRKRTRMLFIESETKEDKLAYCLKAGKELFGTIHYRLEKKGRDKRG